jgi:glycosyltransferase involved in cell wall biosynthesis
MESRVKILHFVPWLLSGGVERRRLLLARGLDKSRFEQRIVCLYGADHMIQEFAECGVHVTEVGGDRLKASDVLAGASIAREWKPAIVHGAVYEGVIMAAMAGLASPKSRVILEEIDYPLHRTWRGKALFQLLAVRSDRCVAVSPAVAEYLASQGIPDTKRRLIVNAARQPSLPPISERARIRGELGIPPEAFVVGSVGRLFDDHKRFSDLLRALKELKPDFPEMHLLIVGEGPDQRRLEELARELGITEAVTFAGYRSDPGPMYAVMDLFALASERESFGLVLAEAMFAALAVVATRTTGIANVVEEGVTGLLVPVAAPAEIAKAIAALRTDPSRRAAMAAAGRARALSLFSSDRYVADVARLYEEIVT